MGIPTYEELMLPLLEILSDENICTNTICREKLAKKFNLSDKEINELLPSKNAKVLNSRFTWAKAYLKQACLVDAPSRGTIKITKRGLSLLKKNLKSLSYKDLLIYDEFKKFIQVGKNKKISDKKEDIILDKAPDEKMQDLFEIIKSQLASELLERVKACDFYFFEKLVIDLLIKMGYGGSREEAGKATKKTADEGIDGIINEDRLGLDNIYIQAKRWKDTVVGRPDIQKFSGALDAPGASKGIFITTSTFSKDAREYVNKINNKKIVLIDGIQLCQYMIDFNVGVSTEQVYEVKKINSDYFLEEP